MAYCVQYGHDTKIMKLKRKFSKKWLVPVGVLLTGYILWNAFPQAADAVKDVLFPWPDSAAEVFVESISAGDGVGEAASAFCRQMLAEAVQ